MHEGLLASVSPGVFIGGQQTLFLSFDSKLFSPHVCHKLAGRDEEKMRSHFPSKSGWRFGTLSADVIFLNENLFLYPEDKVRTPYFSLIGLQKELVFFSDYGSKLGCSQECSEHGPAFLDRMQFAI